MAKRLAGGHVVDVPLPYVDANARKEDVWRVAQLVVLDILKWFEEGDVVHVMGEMTTTYAMVWLFKQAGVKVVASATERQMCTDADGSQRSWFVFEQFREY